MPEIITGLKLSEGIGFGSIFISTRAEIEVSETTIDKAQVDNKLVSSDKPSRSALISHKLYGISTQFATGQICDTLQIDYMSASI